MYTIKDNNLRISVRNIVEFIFASGDIDNRTSTASDINAMQEGTRIHKKIQREMGSRYHAEVSLRETIPLNVNLTDGTQYEYNLVIEGRADGIICDMDEDDTGDRKPLSSVIIDEIKSMYMDVTVMKEPIYVHKAQAMCYAYIYAMQHHLDKLEVQLTYCNIENEHINRFKEEYSIEYLSEWFNGLVAEFKQWSDYLFISKAARTESIRTLAFPYEYRLGQKELAVGVYRTIQRGKTLFIQAPTGVGKTISTVFPAVQAIGQNMGDKIFYLTAKTITRTVAENTFSILREAGLKFKTLTITAKDKICPLDERICNPEQCQYARGHYDRVNDAVFDIINSEESIDRDIVIEYAMKHCVCPFEYSLDISYWCDGIICDYNYVYDPNVYLKRFFAEGKKGDYIFLVDEAHNLVERARNMYSASICKEDILKIKRIIKDKDKKLEKALEKCNKEMLEFKRECDDYKVIDSGAHFALNLERVFKLIQEFRDKQKNNHYDGEDEVGEFFLAVRHYINMYEILDDKYIIYTQHEQSGEFTINLFCVDPSGNLQLCNDRGISTIYFSATLLPIQYYKEMLSNTEDVYAVYAQSSFDSKKRIILASSDVTSRYTRRNINEYRKICRYIQNVIESKNGNYLIFFPSYTYMNKVYEQLLETDIVDKAKIIVQSQSMNESQREDYLRNFDNENNVIGMGVMGGIFSEGIDLKHDSLIGTIIIGTGIPGICNEREILKNYFDENDKNGWNYAYVYPGMNKVLQAAGRVIRTEEDRGIIALLDDRFLNDEYIKLYPREWDTVYRTNVESSRKILDDFWNENQET